MLLGGKTGSKGGGDLMMLSDVDTWELVRFKKTVDMPFVVGIGIRELVSNTDEPAFLERELVGLGVDGYW